MRFKMNKLIIVAALLVGCTSPVVDHEQEKFAAVVESCKYEGFSCVWSGNTLKVTYRGPEELFAMFYDTVFSPLDLPEDIKMRIETYRPIAGAQEWSYRNVDMLFSYSRNCKHLQYTGVSICEGDMKALFTSK